MTLALRKLPSLAAAGVVFLVALAVLTLVNRPSDSLSGGGSNAVPKRTPALSTQARISGLEAAIEAGGGRPQTFAALGSTLMQRLRETGDPGLYSRAEMAFAEALERDPASLDARVGVGALALAR
ncbi:MAG: hypothetical protein ACXWEE_05170, partial [Thermoleophilaceae bacterium]